MNKILTTLSLGVCVLISQPSATQILDYLNILEPEKVIILKEDKNINTLNISKYKNIKSRYIEDELRKHNISLTKYSQKYGIDINLLNALFSYLFVYEYNKDSLLLKSKIPEVCKDFNSNLNYYVGNYLPALKLMFYPKNELDKEFYFNKNNLELTSEMEIIISYYKGALEYEI